MLVILFVSCIIYVILKIVYTLPFLFVAMLRKPFAFLADVATAYRTSIIVAEFTFIALTQSVIVLIIVNLWATIDYVLRQRHYEMIY